jgi:hypothetical protein
MNFSFILSRKLNRRRAATHSQPQLPCFTSIRPRFAANDISVAHRKPSSRSAGHRTCFARVIGHAILPLRPCSRPRQKIDAEKIVKETHRTPLFL